MVLSNGSAKYCRPRAIRELFKITHRELFEINAYEKKRATEDKGYT